MNPAPPTPPANADNRGCRRPLLVLAALLVIVLAGAWAFYRRNLNARPFKPVRLTAPEQQALERKEQVVERIADGRPPANPPAVEPAPAAPAAPDPGLLVLTERELNSLASSRPEFSELKGNLRVDLRPGAIQLDVLYPVDPSVPLMGGKNLRLAATATGGLRDGKFSFVVSSAKVGGIEVPNDWINHLKGRDLGAEWTAKATPSQRAFLNGITSIEVKDDRIEIRLKP